MSTVKISGLPSGTANANAIVPATNSAGTTTQKITLGAIAALGGGPPAAHKTSHATGGTDALTASDIGAAAASHNQAWSTITSTPTTLSGYGITDAVGSSDSRLTDSRTPTAHKTSHATGGSDALSPADIGAPASNPSGITGADAITNIVSLTQAEYDALGSYGATTLYVIV